MTLRQRRSAAFTLIELLVVIAIIAVLVALLLPAIQQAREAANRAQCQSNLKNLGLAFHNYVDVHGRFPMGWSQNIAGGDLNTHAWGTMLLPFLDQQALYDEYNMRQPCVSPTAVGHTAFNQSVIQTVLSIYLCPSTSASEVYYYTLPGAASGLPIDLTWRAARSDYSAVSGILGSFWNGFLSPVVGSDPGNRHGMLADNRAFRPAEVSDGLTKTLLIAERGGGSTIWRRIGQGYTASTGEATNSGIGWGDFLNGEHWIAGSLWDGSGTGGPCIINCTNERTRNMFSFHPGGINYLRGDGSVDFLSESVSAEVFAFLVMPADGRAEAGRQP